MTSADTRCTLHSKCSVPRACTKSMSLFTTYGHWKYMLQQQIHTTGTHLAIMIRPGDGASSRQRWLKSAGRYQPLLSCISTSKLELPGFHSKNNIMLPCAVQSIKVGGLETLASCCQYQTEVLSTRLDQRVRHADYIYQLCIRSVTWEPLADSAFAALQSVLV